MKKILFFLTAALIATSMLAAPVDQFTAMQKAKSFLTNELYAGKFMSPSATNPVLLKAEMGGAKVNQPIYYIFNTSATFIVVAGDDRAEDDNDQPGKCVGTRVSFFHKYECITI